MRMLAGACATERLMTLHDREAVIIRGPIAVVTAPASITRVAFHRCAVAWCKTLPFLPAPFGLALTTERLGALGAQEDDLLQRLADVERHAEVVLSVIPREPPPSDEGRGYLRARASLQSTRTHVVDALTTVAADHNVKSMARTSSHGLDVSFLVSHASLADFVEAARAAIAPLLSCHDANLTGPWPPYSFSRAWIRGYA